MKEERFIDLETRIAYQENLIQELNDVVTKQQMTIDQMERTLSVLVARVRDLMEGMGEGTVIDEKPPHY